jgi:hypothetical protein
MFKGCLSPHNQHNVGHTMFQEPEGAGTFPQEDAIRLWFVRK